MVQDDTPGRDGPAVWDIVRVEFPYADQSATRRRPALVIATPAVEQPFTLLWLAMITSARHAAWPGDVTVTDLAAAGLSRPSYVRTSKVATIDSRYVETIGRLPTGDQANVASFLRHWLTQSAIG
jgi:mRNA-degrading endonuclease toxin of MazEF toxin-antitoxin module